MLLQQTNSSPH